MLSKAIKQVYKELYSNFSKPKIGRLPIIQKMDDDLLHKFLWSHISFVRSHSKSLPLKPRKKLTPQEYAELKRNLESLVHQASYALSYLNKI